MEDALLVELLQKMIVRFDQYEERLHRLEDKIDVVHASQVRAEAMFKIWSDADSVQSDKAKALTKRVDKIENHLGFV